MTFTLKEENISKTYGEIKAVQDISFKTQIGEIIAILGPNGAGKSTLMNMISGFIAPTSGKIFVLEQDISSNAIEGKKNIGFLPEGSPLYPDLTVKEFLNYMAELRGLSRTAKKERLEEIIETAKIKEVYNLESFVRIKNNQIEITVEKEENDSTLANNIMRTIQGLYEEEKYITVKFVK